MSTQGPAARASVDHYSLQSSQHVSEGSPECATASTERHHCCCLPCAVQAVPANLQPASCLQIPSQVSCRAHVHQVAGLHTLTLAIWQCIVLTVKYCVNLQPAFFPPKASRTVPNLRAPRVSLSASSEKSKRTIVPVWMSASSGAAAGSAPPVPAGNMSFLNVKADNGPCLNICILWGCSRQPVQGTGQPGPMTEQVSISEGDLYVTWTERPVQAHTGAANQAFLETLGSRWQQLGQISHKTGFS